MRTAPASGEPALVIDIDGFEGPLDLLLYLARSQKVDLARISVLALAEQYLAFIESVRQPRLELAADYLVMAAWLAFLKSKLLIPGPRGTVEPTGGEMAVRLAFRLKRLEAMREAASRLTERNRVGYDVFARGDPEPVASERATRFEATLYDLLQCYAGVRQRRSVTRMTIAGRQVWSLAEAQAVLERTIGELTGWTALDRLLCRYLEEREVRATAMASSFSASLELVREGRLEMHQDRPFAPFYVRRRTGATASGRETANEGGANA